MEGEGGVPVAPPLGDFMLPPQPTVRLTPGQQQKPVDPRPEQPAPPAAAAAAAAVAALIRKRMEQQQHQHTQQNDEQPGDMSAITQPGSTLESMPPTIHTQQAPQAPPLDLATMTSALAPITNRSAVASSPTSSPSSSIPIPPPLEPAAPSLTSPLLDPIPAPSPPTHFTNISSPIVHTSGSMLDEENHQMDVEGLPSNGAVSNLVSNYMLLEYAAQFKVQSTRFVVKSAKRCKKVPKEVAEAMKKAAQETRRLMIQLRQQLQEFLENAAQRRIEAKQQKMKSAHDHLAAARALLEQTEREALEDGQETNDDTIVSSAPAFAVPAASTAAAAPPAPNQTTQDAKAAVSGLASLMAGLAGASAPAPTPTPAAAALSPPVPGSEAEAAHLSALQQQIQLLKQQMETMAKLQSLMPAAAAAVAANVGGGMTSAAIASSGPAIPLAPSLNLKNVPAPPPSVPMGANVPMAPPMDGNSVIVSASAPPPPPMAPPMAPPMVVAPSTDKINSSSTTAAASMPAMTSARAAVLGEITSRAVNRNNLKKVTPNNGTNSEKSAISKAAPAAAASTTAAAATAAPTVKCYTRLIPGTESLSLSDSIKVASKIKLRRTDLQRSPGGTPIKDGYTPSTGTSSGSRTASAKVQQANASADTAQLLQAALAARFKNVHAHDPFLAKLKSHHHQNHRSHSLIVTSPTPSPAAAKKLQAPTKQQSQHFGTMKEPFRASDGFTPSRPSHRRSLSAESPDKENNDYWETN